MNIMFTFVILFQCVKRDISKMAEASCLTYETKVKGIDMIHLEELQDHVYEQLFIDDSTVFFLPYESTIRYDPKDTFLEQAFMGNCQAFDGYANEIGINGGLEGKPSPLLVACHCGHLSLVQHLCKKRDLVHEVSIKGMTPLFIAASEGHIHIMSWLLQNGADANEQESTGCHPLIVSAFQGRADMVKLLLKFGANANLVDKLGRTALMAAAQQGHTTVINILLQKGALVDLQAHSGSTAAVYAAMADEFDILRILHKFNPKIFSSYGSHGITLMSHICRHGNLDMVKAIQGLDHSLIHQVDDECRTPLMAATEGGHVKMVQYLVENGFSVNTTTDTGTQALTIAILEKNTAIIDILLPMVENVDVTDKYGNTVLLLASAIGDFKTVKSLIDSSADVNHQNLLGFTPLIAASKQGNIEIVKFLHGKNASITKTTKNGLTAQNMAYLYGHFDVSKFLESISQMSSSPHLQLFIAAHGDAIVMKQLWKDHIQDVIGDNIVNQYGVTSLMVASYFGNVEIVEFLLSSNVKVNVPNWHGFTAMEYAVANHKIYVADILAGHGLTFSPNKDGNYLIHAYIMSGCHDQVPDIIRLGSFVVNSKTNDGLTPLMIASQKGMFETVKYLVNHGAVLREKSKEGFTAQEYAFMNDNHSIAGYLKEVEIQQKERKESDNPAQSHFERMLLEFQLRQQLSAGMPAVLPSFSGSVSPFLQACMGDDQETAAKLHQEGYNVHVTDMEGENALTLACDRGSTRLAEWLIVECGLSPNSGNSNNFTALMIASRGGHFGCASLLLDHQAIINAKDVKTSKAALHIAVTNNHTDILELLLNHNAIIDIEDIEGFTPLSLACLRGSIGSVEILLNRGAKVNCRDHVGRTPAMNAARSGHMHILEVLVQHNANLEHITYHGKTASSYAMNRGHHEVVAWIESYLHDKSTKPVVEPKGTSELSIMSSSDSTEQLILSVGEKQNMEPIFCHIPGEEDCPLCFEGLIDNVVEGPASWTYNTILFTCVRKGNLLRLISLLDEGFDVNYQNTEGLTLLMLAASLGDVDTVTILLEHNADVNVKNYQGQDALMLALDAQHFDVAELLADKADTSGDDIVILKGMIHCSNVLMYSLSSTLIRNVYILRK